MNDRRTYKRFTLEDLADELHSDIIVTWKLLREKGINPKVSDVDRTIFYFYLTDDDLSFLETEIEPFYNTLLN